MRASHPLCWERGSSPEPLAWARVAPADLTVFLALCLLYASSSFVDTGRMVGAGPIGNLLFGFCIKEHSDCGLKLAKQGCTVGIWAKTQPGSRKHSDSDQSCHVHVEGKGQLKRVSETQWFCECAFGQLTHLVVAAGPVSCHGIVAYLLVSPHSVVCEERLCARRWDPTCSDDWEEALAGLSPH